MQNPRAILSNAIRGSLDDLQANYQYLAAMDPADRDKVLVDVNVELESVRDAINHPETQKAKNVLLFYQYTTRFSYDVDVKSRSHFLDLVTLGLGV